jgi:hypothetical protein
MAIGVRAGIMVGLVVVILVELTGCQVLTSGTEEETAVYPDAAIFVAGDTRAQEVGERPHPEVSARVAGCSDGTREGFPDFENWPDIAGCAGGFDQAGVLGSSGISPTCARNAGDSSSNPDGRGCSAADLCAESWHVCRDGGDVAQHSPSGDCESCVLPGERLFFLVASGASPAGICSSDPTAKNDLHGCGGLGLLETEACYPLFRRMGFADCLATDGVWQCGQEDDHLDEAAVVTKGSPAMGGVLCCRN